MATMWFARDGRRPESQSSPGTTLSMAEVHAVFGKSDLRYCGTEAPSINPEKPSHSERNVVLETEAEDGVSDLLPQAGFYYVVGLSPNDAKERLAAYRSAQAHH